MLLQPDRKSAVKSEEVKRRIPVFYSAFEKIVFLLWLLSRIGGVGGADRCVRFPFQPTKSFLYVLRDIDMRNVSGSIGTVSLCIVP